MVYGLAAIDSSGRIADRTVIRALGWKPGTRLHIREGSGVIVVRLDRQGVFSLNMGASYSVSGLRYLPRQDGGSGAVNGRIGQYEVYVSTDGTNWGTAVATGAFANDASQKDVRYAAKTGQHLRLRAVSQVAGNPWTSAAEIYALN